MTNLSDKHRLTHSAVDLEMSHGPVTRRNKNARDGAGVWEDLQQLLLGYRHNFLRSKNGVALAGYRTDLLSKSFIAHQMVFYLSKYVTLIRCILEFVCLFLPSLHAFNGYSYIGCCFACCSNCHSVNSCQLSNLLLLKLWRRAE